METFKFTSGDNLDMSEFVKMDPYENHQKVSAEELADAYRAFRAYYAAPRVYRTSQT